MKTKIKSVIILVNIASKNNTESKVNTYTFVDLTVSRVGNQVFIA